MKRHKKQERWHINTRRVCVSCGRVFVGVVTGGPDDPYCLHPCCRPIIVYQDQRGRSYHCLNDSQAETVVSFDGTGTAPRRDGKEQCGDGNVKYERPEKAIGRLTSSAYFGIRTRNEEFVAHFTATVRRPAD